MRALAAGTRRRWAVAAATALVVPSLVALLAAAMLGERMQLVGVPALLVGVVLMTRLPDNRIGWVLGFSGLLGVTGFPAMRLAEAMSSNGAGGAGVVLLAWYSEWFWVPMLYLWLVVLPLLLPSGRAPATTTLRISAVVAAIATASAMFQRNLLTEELATPLRNPVGFLPYGDVDSSPVLPALLVGLLALGGSALLSLLRRYRRAHGVERQQLKIIFFGVAATATAFASGITLDRVGIELPSWVEDATITATPIAILVAVTRYRLYEIDRLVARTVTYGAITIVVVGVYVLIAVVPSLVFAFESDLLVAAATLAAAAVFAPARRRVQAVVERRFDRARYDAARVIDEFAVQLRQDLDLGHLTTDLHTVVSATMQPTTVAVWMPDRHTNARDYVAAIYRLSQDQTRDLAASPVNDGCVG